MRLQYIIKVMTGQTVTEIYLATLASVKREIAMQKRKHPDAQITYAKDAA